MTEAALAPARARRAPRHRRVRAVTLNVAPSPDVDGLVQQAARAAEVEGLDLLVLPESCTGVDPTSSAPLTGPLVTALSALAARRSCYLLAGFDRAAEDGRYVSAVMLDRSGEPIGVYDKRYPYWPELDLTPPVRLGEHTRVWETDFGTVGTAICFDVNFPNVWQDLADAGADLVVWPSAYAGGAILGAYSTIHHYHVLSCTQAGDSRGYDPTGAALAHRPGPIEHAYVFDVDLGRGIYHENYNTEPLAALLADHPDEVEIERHQRPEQWIVLRARRPGVDVRALAHDYGLEELRAYVARSRTVMDELRERQVSS